MSINTGKVVVGGLAAGVVMSAIDFVTNTYLLAAQNKAAVDAISPKLSEALMSTSSTAMFIGIDFVFGLLVVLIYACIRPRFGAGPGTAIKAGLLLWAVAAATWAFTIALGMFSWGYFLVGAVASLVAQLAGAYVGSSLYREPA